MGRKLSTVKETFIEHALRDRVLKRGGVCEKVVVVGKRGFVDRLVILPGPRILFVECKRPRGGVVSPHQRQYHAELKALGVELAIVRTLEDIDRLLSVP